jgi:hypothetical protein
VYIIARSNQWDEKAYSPSSHFKKKTIRRCGGTFSWYFSLLIHAYKCIALECASESAPQIKKAKI